MTGSLSGRTAVVVGAGQTPGRNIGNGRATAITFAREGADLVLIDRDADAVAQTARMAGAEAPEGVRIVAHTVDITSDDGPDELVAFATETFGGFDILHNNVGIGAGDATPHRLTDEGYDRIMDVNLRSMVRICRAAIPVLRASDHGAIVNISSLAAIASAGWITAYKISKAGVNALTQNLAITNAKYGLRANAIMPGFIDTPMGVDAAAAALDVDRDEYATLRAAIVPLGRQGSAWDVANAARFLVSDEAAFITGVMLAVDGGQSARVGG